MGVFFLISNIAKQNVRNDQLLSLLIFLQPPMPDMPPFPVFPQFQRLPRNMQMRLGGMVYHGPIVEVSLERNGLFNDALNTFTYGYMASGIW